MNKSYKVLSIILFFSLMLVFNLTSFAGEKEYVKCVTCGHKMLKSDAVKVSHDGKDYWVCGAKCKAAFEKNPSKFVHEYHFKCPTKGCTFTSDKAGQCPHCKKELVKVETIKQFKCPTKGCTYTSDKAGKCPHCKKTLKESVVEKEVK